MTDTITTTTTQGVVLTDVAAAKVKSLIASEGRDDLV
ncbi:MAG TPA: iron-sulfur cluster insertion protein ErpA, partial [Propionibacteriaceae bacterium]